MTAAKPLHHCYELHGESLAAARALDLVVVDALNRDNLQSTGNLADIQKSWQGFYQRLFTRLEVENPKLLQAVGLLQPSTVIKQGAGEFPRAYLEFAQIFASPQRTPRYFMYVPADHNDAAFVPQGARLLDAAEEKTVNDMLFAGGWLGNAPIVSLARRGIATPAGQEASGLMSSFVKVASQYLPAEVNFIAAGQSLDLVRHYEAALRDYNDKMQHAFDALKAAAEKLFDEILKDLPPGEGLHVNLGGASHLIDGADTCLSISIRRDGKGGDFMAGGKPVTIPDNSYFKVVPYRGSDSAVITRTDTTQGRALAKILRAVPQARPALSDYPALTINGVSPNLITQGQYKILRYFVDDANASMTAPVDARAFPPAALAWLRADDEDRRRGDIPPPMPAAIVTYLQAPLHNGGDSKADVSQSPKKPAK